MTGLRINHLPRFSGMIAAFDAGATHTRYALVEDDRLELKNSTSRDKTPGNRTDFIQAFAGWVRQLQAQATSAIKGVAVAVAGHVDARTGTVQGPNSGAFKPGAIPLGDALSRAVGLPVYLLNDARAFAVGEAIAGAGRGYRQVLGITLGTGVGSSYVVDGKIQSGAHDAAGEAGHNIVERQNGRPCNCGKQGCWETYASGNGLLRTAKEVLQSSRRLSALLTQLGKNSIDDLTTADVIRLHRQQHPAARKIFEIWHRDIAIGLAGVINGLDPQVVVIGGGMAEFVDFDLLREQLLRFIHMPPDKKEQIRLVKAELDDKAALLGATHQARLSAGA